jgi:hypothetical protein
MVPPAYSNDQRAGAEAGVALSRLSSAPNTRPNLQSCQFCRKRKIKCDKLEGGCSQCSRAQNECIYPASQRKGRPRKAGTNRPTPAPTPREAQLLRKIHKLERLVVNLAGGSLHDGSEVNIDTMVREGLEDVQFLVTANTCRIILMLVVTVKRPERYWAVC